MTKPLSEMTLKEVQEMRERTVCNNCKLVDEKDTWYLCKIYGVPKFWSLEEIKPPKKVEIKNKPNHIATRYGIQWKEND